MTSVVFCNMAVLAYCNDTSVLVNICTCVCVWCGGGVVWRRGGAIVQYFYNHLDHSSFETAIHWSVVNVKLHTM